MERESSWPGSWAKGSRRTSRFGISANAMTGRSHAATLSSTRINIYVCPAGKLLKTTGRVLSGYMLRYTASTYDCGPCPLKSKCCPNTPQRIVPRDVNEDVRDIARALMGTPEYEKSRDERKKVEMQ